jgi:hypothetical protein
MAGKKKFNIETPRGGIKLIKIQNGANAGKVYARLEWAPGFKPDKEQAFSNAQEFVDSECLRYMNPLTPRLTGMMIKSATLGTVIGSGSIEYLAPYARRQYYEHKEKARWFETMKASKKEVIKKGASRIASQ